MGSGNGESYGNSASCIDYGQYNASAVSLTVSVRNNCAATLKVKLFIDRGNDIVWDTVRPGEIKLGVSFGFFPHVSGVEAEPVE